MKYFILVLSIVSTLALMACSGGESNPTALSAPSDLSMVKRGADDGVGAPDDRGTDNNGVDINPQRGERVEGTITAIDAAAGRVRISSGAGVAVTVIVVATTKIERNDAHATLLAFRIGDRGQARVNPATLVATKLEATGF